MRPLDTRDIEILSILIEKREPVSAYWIAKELKISSRIVRSRVHKLDDLLRDNGYELTCKPGYGIYLEEQDDVREELRKRINLVNGENCFTAQDRIHIILLILLIQNQPLTIKEIQHELDVSRMTIINDLEKVNCWLTRFDLRLEKRQNYGCTLFGSESSLRRAIIALVFETVGEIELLTLFGNLRLSASFTLHDKTIITQRIGSFIRTLNLELLHAAVDQIQDLTHLTFTDHAHMYLTLYIGIQIYRIKLGKFEETRNSTTQVFQTNAIFVSITPWIKTVERSISVFFPEQEVYELAKQIMGTETRHSISNSSENELNDSEETIKVQRILDLILETATMYLHPALRRDRRLRDDLASHLKNDVNVSGFIPKTNSLLSEVKNSYSDVYKIVKTCLGTVTEKVGWIASDDEAGFITLYLAAALERMRGNTNTKKRLIIVCNSGVATSSLLAARIRSEFPEIEIHGVMSYLEYKNQSNQNDYDLVVSTIPITSWGKPAINVGPFLEYADIQQIRNYLEASNSSLSQKITGTVDECQPSLSDLLTAKTIALQVDVLTWQEVIHQAGQLLVNIDSVEPRYIDAMIHVREEYGPYMVIMPRVALLHAFPEDGVRKTGMSLITLRTPIAFGHINNDPVSLAIVLGAANHHSHLRSLAELVELLHDDQSVDLLLQSYHKSQVLHLIAKYSNH